MDTKAAIREKALALGFDAVGFAPAALSDMARENLAAYLDQGLHGDMGWLAAKADRRGDPRTLWPEARSVIVLGMNYGSPETPNANLGEGGTGIVSVYARGRDYHEIVKSRLKALARWLVENRTCQVKVFVDTAPVMEKPLAERASIGWQGKHTNLVSREFGSWLFLGEVFTDLALEPDAAHDDHCGACRACLDACPTAAFPAPYRLDARRCISYLTIEHKGPIPAKLRPLLGNRIYGCDDCLAACPWNKFARAATEPGLLPRSELTAPRLAELAMLDDAGFRSLFSGSAVKRLGRNRFVRNVLIAIGNSGKPALSAVAERLLDDEAPLVRGAAAWALRRLGATATGVAALERRRGIETDEFVLAELG
ncbi:MAG: tRNA epoxyqueuosine(34) reductase QueG [Alphaproteobacteria bacterium]|nr:tRNA epoxyqueuosine(34) reductase QueG [Alphaproteobacteria bacterium]